MLPYEGISVSLFIITKIFRQMVVYKSMAGKAVFSRSPLEIRLSDPDKLARTFRQSENRTYI